MATDTQVAGDGQCGGAAPSLDLGSQLVLGVCPDAGEAVLYRPMPAKTLRDLGAIKGSREAFDGSDAEWEAELERQHAEDWERNNRRAKRKARRYLVANRLRYMWVLTRLGGHGLHGVEGRAEVMRLVHAFTKALRSELSLGDFPYFYSPELHAGVHGESRERCPIPDECGCSGHGWHVNFFVQRGLPIETVKRLWQGVERGNGYQVRYKDWTRDNRLAALPFVEKLRAGARYATKYATKDWSEVVLADGAHRYEIGQGFMPAVRQVVVGSQEEAERILGALAKGTLTLRWESEDFDEWVGPQCWGYEWIPSRGSP